VSLNCVLLHVRGRSLADLEPAGLLGTDTYLSVPDATSLAFTGLAAREQAGGVTVLSGSPEYVALIDRLAEALETEVVVALFGGVASTYGWFVAGPGVRRERVAADGRPAEDDGDRLPEEDGLDELDEEALLELFRRRTGVDLDWSDDARAEILRPGPVAKPRRGLFRR
jgi:hypothetical protein